MKLFRSVSVNRNACPENLYEAILRLKPDAAGTLSFHLEAHPGDEENARLVEDIVRLCEHGGLKATKGDTVGAYVHLVLPVYEAADLTGAALLLLEGGRTLLYDIERDPLGRLVLPATKAKPSLKTATVYLTHWTILSDETRRTLESGSLAGLQFAEVVVKGQSIQAARTPFWELRTSIGLPRMAGPVKFDERGVALTHQLPHGEIHYCQSDLERVGRFDIAHTRENYIHTHPAFIISQRFYQHCLKHKIPVHVRPVRIDSD